MMMRHLMMLMFCLCLLSFLSLKCNGDKSEISRVWQLKNSDDCDKNFLELNPFVYPYHKYGHKIYLTSSLFYNPSMKQYGLPFENKYSIKDKKILLDGIGRIGFTTRDSFLVLEKDGCKLTFVKKNQDETLSEDSLSSIAFYVSDDEGVLLDSVQIHKTSSDAHIFRIAGSIEKKYLDKTFDERVLDTNEYKIILHLRNGKVFQITSRGKYETPFEVQTLIKYLLAEI